MSNDEASERRVRLKVVGITSAQVQSDVFALILLDQAGNRYIPVMIYEGDAKAIAMWLENIKPPRPSTPDLFAAMASGFDIDLSDVFIYDFSDGIFKAHVTFVDKALGRELTLESRTSDAIALALRMGTPVFTSEAILAKAGYPMERKAPGTEAQDKEGAGGEEPDKGREKGPQDMEDLSLEELEHYLSEAIEAEAYERAAIIKAIIARKKQS